MLVPVMCQGISQKDQCGKFHLKCLKCNFNISSQFVSISCSGPDNRGPKGALLAKWSTALVSLLWHTCKGQALLICTQYSDNSMFIHATNTQTSTHSIITAKGENNKNNNYERNYSCLTLNGLDICLIRRCKMLLRIMTEDLNKSSCNSSVDCGFIQSSEAGERIKSLRFPSPHGTTRNYCSSYAAFVITFQTSSWNRTEIIVS